jgi:hypothetical protein
MKKRKVSTQVLLYFLMMMFLMVSAGCSKSDNPPPPPATTYSISGTVTGPAQTLGTVVITMTDVSTAATSTQTTATDGTYSFAGLANGTYMLVTVLAGYVFNPNPTVVVVNGSNMVQNFVSTAAPSATYYTISGTVMVGETPLSGVKVTLSGSHDASIITGTDGTWSFTEAGGGANIYHVSAYLSGYSITPGKIDWNAPIANSPSNTFTATLANFSQADITGTWNVQMLKSAASAKWSRATLTFDSSGALTGATDCQDNTGTVACPGAGNVTWAINSSTGVIAESGAYAGINGHMTMASNKTFIAGTEDNSKLLIAQKQVTGTSYVAGDVQSKNFVFHQFNVGSSNKWQYGAGTSSAAGAINISSQTEPSGTTVPGDVGTTISVDGSGVVSFSDNETWKGFLSADKKTIVGTDTESGGTEFHMLIIQITDGQSNTISQAAGTSLFNHMLATGAAPAPFWAHLSMDITNGGVITFNGDWLCSNGAVPGPSGSETMTIGSSGTATLAGSTIQETTFNGQLSFDGKFMVATQTFDTDVYSLNVITH